MADAATITIYLCQAIGLLSNTQAGTPGKTEGGAQGASNKGGSVQPEWFLNPAARVETNLLTSGAPG